MKLSLRYIKTTPLFQKNYPNAKLLYNETQDSFSRKLQKNLRNDPGGVSWICMAFNWEDSEEGREYWSNLSEINDIVPNGRMPPWVEV